MDLLEAMGAYGYGFRQHLEEEGWTKRKLTVVDLSSGQREGLERSGVKGLQGVLAAEGSWSFPASEIEVPLPRQQDVALAEGGHQVAAVVAPKGVAYLWAAAERFREGVADRFGIGLEILDDAEAGALEGRSLVLFGGGHDSSCARELALRYQTFFVDAAVPGEGGWVVTTHRGLEASGRMVVQAWASAGETGGMVGCLLDAVERDGDRLVLRGVHRIVPGPEMAAHIPSWKAFVEPMPRGLPQYEGQEVTGPEDPIALADLLAKGFESGGPDVNLYNRAPIEMAIRAAFYERLTGDARGLQLFRELLFRLADYYLKTPEGASYPADLDFPLGYLVLYYARLEHEPVFSNADRLFLSNLLLAVVRSAYEYAMKIWPVEPNGRTRHNHETFPARSMLYSAEYFGRYGVKDVVDWRAYSDAVFSGGLWNRAKQRENANHYEQTAYEHAACYSAFNGEGLSRFGKGVLKQAALRQIRATDNFFRTVDYGDTSIGTGPANSDVLAMLAVCDEPDGLLQWYAHQLFTRGRNYIAPSHGIPGLRPGDPGAPPEAGIWEYVPLEKQFIEDFNPEFPQAHAFDKLVFRSGWEDEDQYVLLEGVGNKKISHAHNDPNGIVRLNQLGRHWIVSNGYGRRTGLSNVNLSFNTRVLGPEDHNMLVLRREEKVVEDVPMCAALLQRGQEGGLAWATGALLNYGGTDWFRTLMILSGRFVLVLDRVHIAQPGIEAAHVEWNGLGEVSQTSGGFRLAQQGVFMDVVSASGWSPSQGVADQSADWKRVLEQGAYPYASFPLKKLVFGMPETVAGSTQTLVTLLAATGSEEPAFRVEETGVGKVRVTASGEELPNLKAGDGDLKVEVSGDRFDVQFAEKPDLPEALEEKSAGASS